MMLDAQTLPFNMIGIKKVAGGAFEDTSCPAAVWPQEDSATPARDAAKGVQKTVKLHSLTSSSQLKAEKDNAEVRLDNTCRSIRRWWMPNGTLRQADRIAAVRAKVVLPSSHLAMWPLSTCRQRLCLSGVTAEEDLNRTMKALRRSNPVNSP